MAKAISTIAHFPPALALGAARWAIVYGSALALIAAGRALPALGL